MDMEIGIKKELDTKKNRRPKITTTNQMSWHEQVSFTPISPNAFQVAHFGPVPFSSWYFNYTPKEIRFF
jgi:hypothetical protein